MLEDGDYSTRQDHYFNYINKRQSEPQTREILREQEKAILKDLKLETYISEDVRAHIEQLEEDPQEAAQKYSFME